MSDCVSDVCSAGKCQAPKCPAGQGCQTDADCNQLKCDPAQRKCLPASHTDGIKNDGETGIDCGGTATTKCKYWAMGGRCIH